MFGLPFGKKKDKKVLDEAERNAEAQQTLDEELEKEKKREQKKKEKAPNWFAVILLIISVVFGLFFWVYGKISSEGVQSLIPKFDSNESFPDTSIPESSPMPRELRNENGVIIFEI